MTVERIDIQISEDGSRTVRRNLQEIGRESDRSANSIDLLKNALKGLAAYLAVDKVRQYADAWATASGRIRVATKSTEEAVAITNALFAAAQNTRSEFSSMVELYTRTARSGKSLGKSQQELLAFTESIGKALAIQGGSAASTSGAMLQLGQALGNGIVRAEEFNSILEGAPYILQVVANNIKGIDGDIGRLRKTMLDGKLSSREFFDAFARGSGDIDKDFAKSALTIAQSMTIVNNALTRYIGELDKSLGISESVGIAAKSIAGNMEQVGAALLAIGAAVTVAFAPAAVTAFAGAVRGLWALVAANPFAALLVALAAVTTYFYSLRDSILLGIDDVTTLGDVLRVLGEDVLAAFPGWLAAAFDTAFGNIAGLYSALTGVTDAAVDNWAEAYKGFYDGVGDGFAGVARGIARTFDAIGGLLIGLARGVVNVFVGLPTAVATPFKMMYNVAVEWVEKTINATIEMINRVRDFLGQDLLSAVSLTRADVDEQYYKKYGETIAGSLAEGFQAQGGALEGVLNGVFDRAAKKGAERLAAATRTPADLTKPLGPGSAPIVDDKAAKEVQKLENAYRSLLNSVDPVNGAILEQKKDLALLDTVLSKKLITEKEHARVLELVKTHYKDLIDPLGRIKREMAEEERLLGMTSQARQVEAAYMSAVLELRREGVVLDAAEAEALRKRIEGLQQLNRVVSEQDKLMEASIGKRQELQAQLAAFENLKSSGQAGFNPTTAAATIATGQGIDISGTTLEVDARIAEYQRMYTAIGEMEAQNIINSQVASQLRLKVDAQTSQAQLANAQTFFSTLATLTRSENRELAMIGKVAAITQATIDGVLGVQKALASAPPPINFALAAAVGTVAAANVAQIASQPIGFMTGGSFTVGGAGGADSQLVSFRATPGERVEVSTPTQVRKGAAREEAQDSSGAAAPQIKIVNVLDPSVVLSALQSTEGERIILNVIEKNPSKIRRTINSA